MEARAWTSGTTISYRYHPLGGKPINLGTDLPDAIRRVLDLQGRSDAYGTLSWLWGQWQTSPRWSRLSAGTREDYALAWKQIEPHLGGMPAGSITSNVVARYVHITRAASPRRANIEKTVLSGMFKFGILLDVNSVNPTIGVESHHSEASVVLPESDTVAAFALWLSTQNAQRRVLGLMAEFTALAGNRRVEFLDLSWPQVDRDAGVIRLKRAKQRGKKRGEVIDRILISPALADVLDRIKALDRGGLYLFPDRNGNAYGDKAWKSIWQRCFIEAITARIVAPEARFNFHSLRRFYATKHKFVHGQLPDLHANKQTTASVYDGTREVQRKSL